MNEELVHIKFDKIMQSQAYTCIVLANEEKKFAIYTNITSGKPMQDYLTQADKQRPSTHDLMNLIFRGLDIKVRQVVINDVQEDGIYFARIFLEQNKDGILHIVEIDARPSDCISLALIHKVPIFCTRSVLEKAIPLPE
jgi:bifunctional DNase/RNase